MRPASLGALGWLLLVAAVYASSFGWLSPRKFRDRWRGPDALSGELTESLACDLVTDFAQQTEHAEVDCSGPLVVEGAVARLKDRQRRTWCLARVPTWTVLRHTKGVPCFPTPPDDPSRVIESERERVLSWAQDRLAARLEGIRTAMRSEVRPRRCALGESGQSGEVPLFEFELLDGPGSVRWSFLSTPWLREAVVSPTPANSLVAMERWGSLRPWVAVVTSATRTEPALLDQRVQAWTRGRLAGTITLVDAETGTLRCEAKLAFETSQVLVPIGLPQFGSERSPVMEVTLTEERVRSDFEAAYRKAARTALNDMTTWDAWPASQ